MALKHLAAMQSGEQITADRIEEAGPFPVFGGNGLRGFTTEYTHEGEFALIGRQGALCGNINYAAGRFWASEHAVVVTPKTACATRWLGELLGAMNLGQYSITAAQPGLSVEVIGNLRVPVPPFPEQVAIAAFLDRECGKIDGLVAEQERLIALLKEKRQAVITQAVTKGLDPDAPMKDSGIAWLGQVPAHWEVSRLGALFSEVAEDGEDGLPVLSVSIHSGVSDDELADEQLERKVTRSEDRTKYKKVEPGDLVYNMMRAWQGGFGTVSVAGMVSPAYVVARPVGAVRTQFIEFLLRSPQAVEEMRRHSRGVTDFRLRLYWDEFKQIRVALPAPPEQEAILAAVAAEIARSDSLAAEAERAIALLKERRAALISAAVTGKIDVRRLAATNAAEAA
jgi:type I restriction enzyme S subunit